MNTPTTLGRYTLEAQLGQGGMAAVYLGRIQGPAGFTKRVVIKRILKEHAQNPHFVEMFLGEARLAALLNHPNVVQIYDFGEDRGEYFLAMEHIDGVSLRDLTHHLGHEQRLMPPAVAIHLSIGAASGLEHVHGLADESGKPLHLVHRDISPDNLLVTRAGVVKVTDFGVAKASALTPQTTTGAVKGKPAYMAPEQVTGRELDGRVDLYALGVTLYELLSGHRPFKASNEIELALMILERAPAPLTGVDPALAAVVMRALEKDRERRFPTAQAFRAALEQLPLYDRPAAEAELRTLVEDTLAERGDPTLLHPRPAARPAADDVTAPSRPSGVREASPRRWAWALAASVVCAAIAGAVAARMLGAAPAPAPAPVVEERAPAPPAPAPASPSPPPPAEPAPPEAVTPAATEPRGAPRKKPVAEGSGFLTLRTSPWCNVQVDAEGAGATPLVKRKLAAGPHTLELSNEKVGLQSKVSIVITAGQTLTRAITFPVGQVKVAAPAGTKVFRGSELLGTAPMPPLPLVAGRHTLGLVSPGGAFSTREVRVPAAGEVELSVP